MTTPAAVDGRRRQPLSLELPAASTASVAAATGTSIGIAGTTAIRIGSAASAANDVAITRCRAEARAVRRERRDREAGEHDQRGLGDERQLERIGQQQRRAGQVRDHHFLRFLRT